MDLRRLVAIGLLAFGGFGVPVEAGEGSDGRPKAACRSCGSGGLTEFLSLGPMPLTDAYPSPEKPPEPEPRYPLEVAFCPTCRLVQILYTVPPEDMFKDYQYYSSFSNTILEHSRRHVDDLIVGKKLGHDSLVVELASNDGYLLRNFVEAGVPVLGIDPARGPAEAAEAIGVPTLVEFFGPELAARLVTEGRSADVLIANNVLAHVPDLNGFVAGIATVLKDDGIAEIEVPYVKDLVDNLEFDTIYHEHLCYFSVTALDRLFRRHGLYLNRVEPLAIHGGSLRLFVEPAERPDASVTTHLEAERRLGLDRLDYYAGFAARVRSTRDRLAALLAGLKRRGARIAGYGAAAKGAILLNYVGIGPETLDFVVDRNVHKQGRWLPGVRLPITAPERLLEVQPDYVLILPWNFKEEIMEQQAEYRRRGGRFIVPIPEPVIL
jgi:SAM-dependent methyltransferase